MMVAPSGPTLTWKIKHYHGETCAGKPFVGTLPETGTETPASGSSREPKSRAAHASDSERARDGKSGATFRSRNMARRFCDDKG
jgi:hypothetical protein